MDDANGKPFYLNTVNDPEPRRLYFEHVQYPAANLVEVLLLISANSGTGSLTINFSQGKPAGTVEWKQKSTL